MKKIFCDLGTPRKICTDSGLPFNSNDFQEFALEEGFEHHRVTPLHPQANREAESFMRPLNKMERIAHLQQRDHDLALSDLLTGYRSTPHPATGVAPYDLIANHKIRSKLCDGRPDLTEGDPEVTLRDANYKAKQSEHYKGHLKKPLNFSIGDFVLVRQKKQTKLSTPYEPVLYSIIEINGTQVTVQRTTDGRCITRHADQLKNANRLLGENETPAPRDYHLATSDEWDILKPEPGANHLVADPAEIHHPAMEGMNDLDIQEADHATKPQLEEGQGTPTQSLRRSNRRRMPPKHLKDYLT